MKGQQNVELVKLSFTQIVFTFYHNKDFQILNSKKFKKV
jgi:hypothetical protein